MTSQFNYLTFSLHAGLETFFEPTILTVVTRDAVHNTIAAFFADIIQAFLDGALEETLASLATEHRIVITRAFVGTNHAQWRVRREFDFYWRLQKKTRPNTVFRRITYALQSEYAIFTTSSLA